MKTALQKIEQYVNWATKRVAKDKKTCNKFLKLDGKWVYIYCQKKPHKKVAPLLKNVGICCGSGKYLPTNTIYIPYWCINHISEKSLIIALMHELGHIQSQKFSEMNKLSYRLKHLRDKQPNVISDETWETEADTYALKTLNFSEEEFELMFDELAEYFNYAFFGCDLNMKLASLFKPTIDFRGIIKAERDRRCYRLFYEE
jgi:hypothetical protein